MCKHSACAKNSAVLFLDTYAATVRAKISASLKEQNICLFLSSLQAGLRQNRGCGRRAPDLPARGGNQRRAPQNVQHKRVLESLLLHVLVPVAGAEVPGGHVCRWR